MKNFLQKNKSIAVIFALSVLITMVSGLLYWRAGPGQMNQLLRIDGKAVVEPGSGNETARPAFAEAAAGERQDKKSQESEAVSGDKQSLGDEAAELQDVQESGGWRTSGDGEATTDASQPAAENKIAVSVSVNDQSYQVNAPAGSTVYDALNELKIAGKINFNGKNYSGLGYFVEEINGLKNNDRPDFYWIYYINNKQASMGISNYIIKSGDVISWKYEKNQF